ncbi:amidohydrolase [Vallitalea longa]|uniref:Amidohydrolase n=1 Tax=Vallitalea longa TaxID=2936439 RepID=A0A9W5Y9E2_9FIRM|nr:amidohydrolase family protein [Vallitalea longa]GKX28331.1 amidohydrolase [Vallitalea longa]
MKLYIFKELFNGEERLFNQSIITDGEKIIWTGDSDSDEISTFTISETIDMSDNFVMPGLIDCHVHLASIDRAPTNAIGWAQTTINALDKLKKLMTAGVVACRDLGSCEGVTIGISNAQKCGELEGLPKLISSGKALTATGGHGYEIGVECDGVDEFTKGARLVIKEGADIVKVMMSGGVNSLGEEQGPPEVNQEEIDAAVREAHARGRKVAVHAHGNTAIKRSVLAGVDSIEHGVFNSEDIMKLMIERGTFLVPTLCAPYYATVEGIRREPDNPDHKKSKAILEIHNKATLKAFSMGIPLAMGTDAGCPFNPHERAFYELVLLHNIGIDTADVLKIGTKNGAILLDQDQLGMIAVGKEASFIALSKSPFEDFNAIEGPKDVWIKGTKIQ